MTDLLLEAELRDTTGKANARRMRRAGKIPAIIYGGDKPDLAISFDFFAISKHLEDETFYNSMLDLKVKGSRGKNTVLLKDIQWDPVKETVMHLDFFRVNAADAISADIPVHIINDEKCPGAIAGGLVEVIRRHLSVQCRADSIPEFIEVDCSKLTVGDSIHILDIELPDGVTITEIEQAADGEEVINFTVITCVAPTVEKASNDIEEEDEEDEAE